jgi:signal transduction histidine kinase
VHELLEDALEPFRPRLATLAFELTVDVAPGLPRLRVDRSAIVLVFENLIDNAIKYSSNKKLLVISARPDGSHFVHVKFADRGIGIPDTDIRHVFEKFFRSHNVTESGSGLGLSIARRIVLFHAGHIDIQSTERVGTTVTVILPASRS